MFKKLTTLALATTLAVTTGCATMFNGSSQTVNIRSNDESAKLYVNNEYLGRHSTAMEFKKKQDYTIRVEKDGCEAKEVKAEKSFDPTSLLGILIDYGIISMLVVDTLGTGAIKKFDQTSYVLDPKCPQVKTTPLPQQTDLSKAVASIALVETQPSV